MSAATYEHFIHDPLGARISAPLPVLSWESVKAVNTIGTLTLRLPFGAVPSDWLGQDYIIIIWRSINGGTRVIHNETIYYVQLVEHDNTAGQLITTVHCVDTLERLRRRIVAYYAGSAQARKGPVPADNLMKALVRENLSSAASDYAGSTARGLSASGFTVEGDLGLAATDSKGCAWRNLYDALREIADSSRTAGTWLAFDMVPIAGLGQQFRTYINQRGIDRRSGAQALTLSEAAGTLINAKLTLDYRQAVTAVYAGGRGEESARLVQTAVDSTRVRSPAGRIEDFTTAYDGDSAAYVLSEAQSKLASQRPQIALRGEFQETTSVLYGRDISFGDYVKIEGFGYTLSARLDVVKSGMTDQGEEQIMIALRSETLL